MYFCNRLFLAGLVMLAMALALGGCGTPTGLVTGRVTWKSQPVPGADLRFELTSDAKEHYRGLSGEDGSIHVDYKNKGGLPVGSYKITIKHYTLRGKLLPPGEAGDALKGEEQTVTHTTIFEKTITSGSNEFHLELSEGKKAGK